LVKEDRSATLVKQLDTGEILVKVDNGQEEIVDARPRTVVGSSQIQRVPGLGHSWAAAGQLGIPEA